MTAEELVKEYPLLSKKSMAMPKISIIDLGDDDGLMDDRGLMMELFDEWAGEDRDKFFWEWLSHVKFILENATAYTTPNKIIALNYPCTDIIPQDNDKFARWFYVYCHECLHQLWDTFDVGRELQKEGTHYDHELLNIASDCVINDFLSNINTKHKKEPVAGITPKYIEEQYGVKYDRKVDTQKSLYIKLLGMDKDKQEELKQNADKFDGKIKPKDVKQTDGGGGGGQDKKHTPDYIKGWHDGIQDVLDKKVDPSKYTPKKVKGDYEQGYNDVIEQINQGLENGLELSNGESQGGGSDLAQIPWDMDPQSSKSSQSTQDSADDAQQADKDGDEEKAQEALNNAKESAQDVADKCKETAAKAKEAAKKAPNKEVKKKLEDAAKNCEEKADALEKAIKDASKSKDISKTAQDVANKTKEANDATQNALSEIKEQSGKSSDTDGEKSKTSSGNKSEDSKDGNGGDGEESDSDSKSSSNKGGNGAGDVNTRELEEELKRHGEEICKKYKDYTMGTLGEFVKKCKISKTTKGGLMMNNDRGSSAWNKELELTCKQFVNQKLKNMKIYRNTYNRVRRGERAYSREDLRSGRRIIQQGREEIKNKIGFDIALYIDTSGSMSNCIDKVFTAAYSIVDELKSTFGKDKNVDASKINLKSFIFTTEMREIPYGKKSQANGGTYSFEDLLGDIYKREANAFLNIVITDGDFNGINNTKVAETIDKMEGLFVMVTNKKEGEYNALVKAVQKKCGPKLQAIYADNNFTVKK